jgi:hypothetical protein
LAEVPVLVVVVVPEEVPAGVVLDAPLVVATEAESEPEPQAASPVSSVQISALRRINCCIITRIPV